MLKVYSLLHNLGITANYAGFFYTSRAVALAMEDMEYLLLVTKRLYPKMARHFHTSPSSIERGIRTVVDVSWKNHKDLLSELAHKPLQKKPSVSEFIAILTLSVIFAQADGLSDALEEFEYNLGIGGDRRPKDDML